MSVVIAELTMQHIESKMQNVMFNNNQILLWKRYVDDCIAIIKTSDIEKFLEHINSIDNSIQFTIEKENNNQLPFLDVNIIRLPDGKVKFKVYRKPTATGRYLDYNSNNPISHKINTVTALQRRAYTICSDVEDRGEELEIVRKDLQMNGYPSKLLDNCHRSLTAPRSEPIAQQDNLIKITAPYIKGTTERVKRLLRNHNVKLFDTNKNSLKSKICRLKDKRNNSEKSNIVYEFSCGDCPAKYIGESSRTLKVRSHEHSLDIANKRIRNHMFVHQRDNNHKFNLNDVRVLAQEKRSKPRKFVEGLFSKLEPNSVNNAQEIPSVYINVLK